MDSNEFLKHHWKYYLYLEKEVMDTFQYSTLDKTNSTNFSFEYIKLLQIICSEIDVLCKSYCEFMSKPSMDTIAKYSWVITVAHPDVKTKLVRCKENNDLDYIPFGLWEYTVSADKNGIQRINGTPPKWWSIYNKVKHERMSVNSKYKKENYKLANQENLMNALAGLFLLEMYFFKDIILNENSNNPNIPSTPSKLFDLDNWANGIMYGDGLFMAFN